MVKLGITSGGSTLPNLLDLLSSRGNKDYRAISRDFGVVNSAKPVQTIWGTAVSGFVEQVDNRIKGISKHN